MTRSILYWFQRCLQIYGYLLLLLGLIFSTQAVANTQYAPPTSQQRIMVLGDSISAAYGINSEDGWVNLLAQRIADSHPQWQIINASISGNTTGDGLARLPKLLESHQPSIVIIELGGNDGLRGHPLKKVRHNLIQMIELSRQNHARVLLLGIEIPPNYGQRYTNEFRSSFLQIATKSKVAFVPFILQGIALNKDLMQADGIHPTETAQPQILNNVWPKLTSLLTAASEQEVR